MPPETAHHVGRGPSAAVVNIGQRAVGPGHPVYVIAEAGSNHNGSKAQALRLVDVAVEAGADAVKFQLFRAESLYPATAGASDYLRTAESIYQIIRDMEMPEEWIPELADYSAERGIEFLCTPFDERAADVLAPYVRAFKIASYEMTHLPLLRHVARLGKPLLVSTGTADIGEVVHAVDAARAEGNAQIVVLQCTASYPAPLETVNVRAMLALADATGCVVGLSDHSREPIIAPVTAAALGACVIEKHFTLSNRLPGPDHQYAVEPDELAALVRAVRQTESALGHGRKEALPVEQELRAFARRSIYATRPIRAGESLTAQNIAVLRCGKLPAGLPPEDYPRILGRVVRRDVPADSPVALADLE